MTKATLFSRLGTLLHVSNFANKTNQHLATFKHGEAFSSYGKIIGVKHNEHGQINFYFDPSYHDYSKTTSKYCKQWSGLSAESRRRACADPSNERYQYVDLN